MQRERLGRPRSSAGFSMNQGDSGSNTGGAQCSASCALLVPYLGAAVGTMGECVSDCQAMAIPAALPRVHPGRVQHAERPCGQCFASAACRGSGHPTDAGVDAAHRRGAASDPCASATSCGDCTARSTCGWCNGRCYVGSSSGPTGASCGESSWAWVSSQCSSTPPPTDAGSTGGGIGSQCQGCVIGGACASNVPACLTTRPARRASRTTRTPRAATTRTS
ncbi:MAG: hypothetical protein R3A52_19135 [Polyangiales bacterium]